MNQIAELLPIANIALDLDVASKSRLFEAAGALFAASSGLDPAVVSSSLAAREKLGSTGLGQGIAIPHGRIKGLKEFVMLQNCGHFPIEEPGVSQFEEAVVAFLERIVSRRAVRIA